MNIQRSRNRILLLSLALAALLAAGIVWYMRPGGALATNPIDCSGDWASSTSKEVRDTCAEQKEIRTQEEDAQAEQTSLALPTSVPAPPLTQSQLPEPDEAKIIRMTGTKDPTMTATNPYLQNAGGPYFYNTASSSWQAGSVPSDAKYSEWDPLWVTTHAGNGAVFHIPSSTDTRTVDTNPTLETSVLDTTDYEYKMSTRTWTCPKPVGDLYITNIVQGKSPGIGADGSNFSGLNYIVYFKTKDGHTGHFDMVTQIWTFD